MSESNAQQILNRINTPLSADERKLCEQQGWDEVAHKQARDAALRQGLASLPGYHPGHELGLTKAEADIADRLCQSYEAFAAEKALQGGLPAKTPEITPTAGNGATYALNAAEMQVARNLGITYEAFAAEKAKLAG